MWFLLYYYVLVIHQATQNLNYSPDLQSHGYQSMSIGMVLFTLWFPVWCFTIWLGVSQDLVWCFTIWLGVSQDLVWCFTIWLGVSQDLVWCFAIGPRSYLNWCLAASRPHLLQQPLYSVNQYSSTPLVLFYPVNFKLPPTIPY